MPKILPKISIDKPHITATKQFTDRTGFIETFWNSINSIQNDDIKVLVYYGVGGIGKSSLRKKLQDDINRTDKNIVWSSIDFEINQHREVDNALIFLRTELSKKYKISFNLFDFAYAYYLKKTSPQIPIDKKTLPFIEEGSLVTDIITTFNDIPLLGIPTKIAMLLNKGHNLYKEWITQKRIEHIIDMSLKEPKELLEYLPAYFAEDLKNYISAKGKKIVIFLDTYEALNSNNKNEKAFFQVDEWLRDVLIPNLPGVLFIILGREKLKWQEINSSWSECIEQHLIGTLADTDAKKFLESAGIKNIGIINSIIEISQGHPYSLDLCVDTYEAIRKERNPVEDDFKYSNNKVQIFERFMKYLQISERETLKVLSVPRFWDDEIFNMIIKEYNTGYPTSAINEFCKFSFISERVLESTWEMHSLMRKSLNEYQEKEQLDRIHKFMFNYYSNKLLEDNNKAQEIYLNEAYYHGKNYLDKEPFIVWFLEKSNYFMKTGNTLFLKDLLQELLEDLKNNNDKYKFSSLFSQLSYKLGKIYMTSGNYLKSEEILKCAEAEGTETDRTNIASVLAMIYKNSYKYKEAAIYFVRTIDSYGTLEKDDHNMSNLINKTKISIEYGKLKVYLSENHEALDIYNKVLLEIEDLLKYDNEVYTLLSCKAVVLEKLGEINKLLCNYKTTEELYKKAVDIYDQMINKDEFCLEENSDLIYMLNNKGMVYKRLAGYYVSINKIEDAKLYYRKALEIYEDSVKISSENVDTYKKIGFATRGLLRQLAKHGNAEDEVEQSFNKCIEAFNKAVELSPKDVAAIHSMGGAYMIVGRMHEKDLNYNKSLELYDLAIEHSVRATEIQPDYLYAYNGKTETLMHKAEIYIRIGNVEKGLSLYEEGLKTIDEVLKRTPQALYAIKKKEAINSRIIELRNDEKQLV